MRLFRYSIDFSSFFKKGLPKIDDDFGVYCFAAKQGRGKTYSAIRFLNEHTTNRRIFCNFSTKIPHTSFSSLSEIWSNTDDHCIFVIDEIFKKYNKQDRVDRQFLSWLSQSRKHGRIVIIIAQEWRELNMTLRRYCKRVITCDRAFFGLLQKNTWGDAENMVFNELEGEYECPPISIEWFKRNKKIASLYDTFESVELA